MRKRVWFGLFIMACILLAAPAVRAGEDIPDDPMADAEEAPPPPPPPAPPPPEDIPPPPLPPDTGEEPLVTETTPPDAGDVTGQTGVVNAARVNVRAGPSTRYEIVVTLSRNTEITIVAKSDEWLKIAYPQGEYCYIHPQHLAGDIPANIPESGLVRSVQSPEAPIRVRGWERSSVVGTAKQGDLVTLVGLRGQWAKILPPPSAHAWVFAKYVDYKGNVAQTTDTPAPAPDNGTDSAGVEDPLKKPVTSEVMRERIRERYQVLAEQYEKQKEERQQRIDDILQDIESQLQAIDEEVEIKKARAPRAEKHVVTPPPTPETVGGFTGWVEYIGRAGRRPAAFRLVKGGETLFLLRSAKIDLADFVNRRVICDGSVELAPGFEANVLVVDHMQMLDVGPISVQKNQPDIRRPYVSPERPRLADPPPVETEEPAAEEPMTRIPERPMVIEENDAGGDEMMDADDGSDAEELPGDDDAMDEDDAEEPAAGNEEPASAETPADETPGAVVAEPGVAGEGADLPPPPPLPETIGAGEDNAPVEEKKTEAVEVTEDGIEIDTGALEEVQ